MKKNNFQAPEIARKLDMVLEKVELLTKHFAEQPEQVSFLTASEWCEQARAGRWKLQILLNNNLIPGVVRVGRKLLIPSSSVMDYIHGNIQLPPLSEEQRQKFNSFKKTKDAA